MDDDAMYALADRRIARRVVRAGPLSALVYDAWVLTANFRIHGFTADWTKESITYTLMVEWIQVQEDQRQQGHCRRFLEGLLADPAYVMVMLQGVQNYSLAAALARRGWESDPVTKDFWKRR